jgi:xylulokinase
VKSYFIGFDLGSHSTKGVIIGEDGIPLFTKNIEHSTATPNPGWQEQDSNIWWQEIKFITKELLLKSNIDSSSVKAVGITGFVPGLVMLDKDNQDVRPAIMHTDIRAVQELKYINDRLKIPISHGFLLPKLIWIRENENKNYCRISKILVPHSFIVQRLTGKYSSDIDTATLFGLFDSDEKVWSEDLCNKLGIDTKILPDLYNADSIVGTVSTEASFLTGLAEGTPVIAGTGDTFAAILGCGAVSLGDMMIYLGTSGTQLFINGELNDFIHGPHFGPGKAEFTGRIISCGDSMKHYSDILGFDDWSVPDKKALDVEPGSKGLFIFPHLKQKTELESFTGDRETIFGLDTSHDSWHIYRAVLEGIAYNLKSSFIKYESSVKRLILSGGGARSRVFREIISTVLDKELICNISGNGSIGIALLAAHSVVDLPLKQRSLGISDRAELTKPDKKSVSDYKKQYRRYLRLRKIMEELYKEQIADEDE